MPLGRIYPDRGPAVVPIDEKRPSNSPAVEVRPSGFVEVSYEPTTADCWLVTRFERSRFAQTLRVVVFGRATATPPCQDSRKGNPGFVVRISPKGFRYANTVAGNLLNSAIQNAKIPNVTNGYANAKNMRISAFQPPTYSYSLSSPNRFTWSIRVEEEKFRWREIGKF